MNLPDNLPPCPECIEGYVQETGFDRCDKCNSKPASGVDARVCDDMSDRPTPLTDKEIMPVANGAGAWMHVVPADFARDLERQRDAYAETLRIIASANQRSHHESAFAALIRERHPELAEGKP